MITHYAPALRYSWLKTVHRAAAVAVWDMTMHLLLCLTVLQVIGQGQVQFMVVVVALAVRIGLLLQQQLISVVVPFTAVAGVEDVTTQQQAGTVEPLFGVAQVLREQLHLRILPMVLSPEAVRVEQKPQTQATGVMAEFGLLIGKNI
jgi:hypothetical protein